MRREPKFVDQVQIALNANRQISEDEQILNSEIEKLKSEILNLSWKGKSETHWRSSELTRDRWIYNELYNHIRLLGLRVGNGKSAITHINEEGNEVVDREASFIINWDHLIKS